MQLEAEAMLSGAWRNFDHLEEELSMQELAAIVQALRDREWQRYKMQAALKGIDVDKARGSQQQEDDPVAAAKKRVAKKLAVQQGMTEGQYEAKESEKRLQGLGFSVNKVTR